MSDQMIRIRWTRGKTNMCQQAPFAVEGRQARYTNNLGDLPEGTFNFTQILDATIHSSESELLVKGRAEGRSTLYRQSKCRD